MIKFLYRVSHCVSNVKLVRWEAICATILKLVSPSTKLNSYVSLPMFYVKIRKQNTKDLRGLLINCLPPISLSPLYLCWIRLTTNTSTNKMFEPIKQGTITVSYGDF